MSGNTEYISVNEMIVNWNKILSRIGKISGWSASTSPKPDADRKGKYGESQGSKKTQRDYVQESGT